MKMICILLMYTETHPVNTLPINISFIIFCSLSFSLLLLSKLMDNISRHILSTPYVFSHIVNKIHNINTNPATDRKSAGFVGWYMIYIRAPHAQHQHNQIASNLQFVRFVNWQMNGIWCFLDNSSQYLYRLIYQCTRINYC